MSCTRSAWIASVSGTASLASNMTVTTIPNSVARQRNHARDANVRRQSKRGGLGGQPLPLVRLASSAHTRTFVRAALSCREIRVSRRSLPVSRPRRGISQEVSMAIQRRITVGMGEAAADRVVASGDGAVRSRAGGS